MSDGGSIDYRVNGRIRFRNLVRIREEGEAAIAAASGPVVIDLSGLEHSNSAAVALLMAWYRAATSQDKAIRFVGSPAELENIVELSGLTDVLPLEGSEGATEASLAAEADS